MSEFEQLKLRIDTIETMLKYMMFSDRYIFQKHIQIFDAQNISFGTNKGTMIGKNTTEKFAFHGSTPVVQRANANQAVVAGSASGTYGATEQALINNLITLTNELRASLVEKGLVKGSA